MNILGKAQIKKYMCYKLNSLIIITVKKILTAKIKKYIAWHLHKETKVVHVEFKNNSSWTLGKRFQVFMVISVQPINGWCTCGVNQLAEGRKETVWDLKELENQ